MSLTMSRAAPALFLIHPKLVPFPVVCFVGALLTDLAYWRSADMQWANFSVWLLTAGLLMGAVAAVASLVDLVRVRRARVGRPAWLRLAGALLATVIGLLNVFVHSRDAYTSVVPTGLALSALAVFVLLLTGCFAWSMVRRSDRGDGA